MIWTPFLQFWPFMKWTTRRRSPSRGHQWATSMFSFMFAGTCCWTNGHIVGDLRLHYRCVTSPSYNKSDTAINKLISAGYSIKFFKLYFVTHNKFVAVRYPDSHAMWKRTKIISRAWIIKSEYYKLCPFAVLQLSSGLSFRCTIRQVHCHGRC